MCSFTHVVSRKYASRSSAFVSFSVWPTAASAALAAPSSVSITCLISSSGSHWPYRCKRSCRGFAPCRSDPAYKTIAATSTPTTGIRSPGNFLPSMSAPRCSATPAKTTAGTPPVLPRSVDAPGASAFRPSPLVLVPPRQRQALKRFFHSAQAEDLVDSFQLLLPLTELHRTHDGRNVSCQMFLFRDQQRERANASLGGHFQL